MQFTIKNVKDSIFLIITSTEVVLLERRDACIMMKQRRLNEKATFKTVSKHKICKKQKEFI